MIARKRSFWITTAIAIFFEALPIVTAFLKKTEISLSIIVMVTIVFFYLVTLGIIIRQNQEDLLCEFKRDYEIKFLSESEFYNHFLTHIERAKCHVDIMYLGPEPPGAQSAIYRRKLREKIHEMRDVQFRRIIRVTPQNLNWIRQLTNAYKGVKNFSLACLCDENITDSHLSAISVQRIDSQFTWLVAIKEHKETREIRDIFISSSSFNELFTAYFNRLYAKARVVLREGSKIDPELHQVRTWVKSIRQRDENGKTA